MRLIFWSLISCFGVLFGVFSLGQVFNIESVIFKYVLENGQMYLKFDLYSYLNNFNGTFVKFQEFVSELGTNHYNWSGFIESIKSLCNVLITLLNVTLIPFSFIGSVLNVFLCIFGMPLNNSNPLYLVFNGISGLQIPYIPV